MPVWGDGHVSLLSWPILPPERRSLVPPRDRQRRDCQSSPIGRSTLHKGAPRVLYPGHEGDPWSGTLPAPTRSPRVISRTPYATRALLPGKPKEGKKKKYAFLLDRYIFEPIAMETTGVWGEEGLTLIQQIGQRISAISEQGNSANFLRQRLSLPAQRGSILGKLLQEMNWRKCIICSQPALPCHDFSAILYDFLRFILIFLK